VRCLNEAFNRRDFDALAHGARSGVPVLLRWANVSWFEGGKIARAAGYAHRREALKAVGLEG